VFGSVIFEPVVCVYGTAGRLYRTHIPHVQKFQSSTALYSLMMDHRRSETCRSDF